MANPAHIEARFRCAIPACDLPTQFGIVTAFNPFDQIATAEANTLADRHLVELLAQRGWPHFRVIGGDVSFSHQEPGWGIAVDSEELLDLGREFHQVAIFWIENGTLWLLDCNGGERIILGKFVDRTAFLTA